MGRFIVKLRDCYMEWSTIGDAPVSALMALDDFEAWHLAEYGRSGHQDFVYRIARADERGTSCISEPISAEDAIAGNRAGPGESELTEHEIFRAYGLRQPIRDGWTPWEQP